METIFDRIDLFQQFLTLIANHFGENCEVVLHDLTKGDYDSIVDIRNGHVTGRKIGDCGSNMGLEVMRGTVKDADRANRIVHTQDGKILRSSTMFIKNDQGKIVGALCVNLDITESVRYEEFLHRTNQYDVLKDNNDEIFVNDVNDLLDYMIFQSQSRIGKPPQQMNKQDKLEFLRYLDSKGAFLITKSGDRVREYLAISKFTLYNYLDEIRNMAG